MSAVLLVEPSLTVRMHLTDLLSGGGLAVAAAADAAGARRALDAGRFDVVLLEPLLPDGDGLELLAALRREPRHARPRVALLGDEQAWRERLARLGLAPDAWLVRASDPEAVLAQVRALAEAGPGRAAAPRVLVIDDSATAREELREALEEAGLTVETATSGEEGLLLAARQRPALVVVDGVMPGMDGAGFVRHLRADPSLQATPCVLLTGGGAVEELPALEAGADAYLRKEEGRAIIVARVQALLRSAAPAPAPAGGLPPRRLLAVAERASDAAAVAAALADDRHAVERVETVDEALARLAAEPFDALLVVDGARPGGALEACAKLRAGVAPHDLPLVVLGAADAHDAVLAAIEAGADDYVPLATAPRLLRARLRAHLRRKALADEARRREAYAQSAAVLETIADAFFAVDPAWRFVYVNHAAEELLGAPRAALAGTLLWDVAERLGGAALERELRAAVERRSPATFEAPAGERWLEVRAFPHAEGLSAHLRDVTERRRSEEVQAHLLGIVGHDLRTPLTAIAASVGLVLRDRALPPGHRRSLDRVAGATTRMKRLINDLLDYSRARLGRGLPLSPAPADLGEVCGDVLAELRAAHPGRTFAYGGDGDGRGEWDAGRLAQVLTNLLTNAVRYSPEESEVSLRWRGEGERVSLSVHNDGAPIDPALRERLFEPFERGDASGKWGGVGLGLYIVSQIVLAHRGAIDVESTAERGTTFRIALPRRVGG